MEQEPARGETDADALHRDSVAIGQGAILHLVGAGLSGIMALGVTLALSRWLGYEALGLYSIGLGAMVVGSMATKLGLKTSSLHVTSSHLASGEAGVAGYVAERSLLIAVALGVLGTIALWFLAPFGARLFGGPRIVPVLRAFAFGIPLLNALEVAVGSLRGSKRILEALVPRKILYPGIQLGLVIAFLVSGFTVEWAAYATVLALGIAAVSAVAVVARAYPRETVSLELSGLLRFGFGNLSIQFLHKAIRWIVALFLAVLLTSSDVGLYRAIGQTVMLLSLVLAAVDALYAPLVSRMLARGEKSSLTRLSRSMARLCFLATAATSIPLVLAADPILSIFGEGIREAVPAFTVLAFGFTLAGVLGPVPWILIAAERLDLEIAANVAALIAVAGLGIFLIPTHGVLGATIATAVGTLVRTGFRYRFLRSGIGIAPLSKPLSIQVATYCGLLLSGFLAKIYLGGSGLVVAVLAILVFLGIAAPFGMTPSDRRVLANLTKVVRNPHAATWYGHQGPVPSTASENPNAQNEPNS